MLSELDILDVLKARFYVTDHIKRTIIVDKEFHYCGMRYRWSHDDTFPFCFTPGTAIEGARDVHTAQVETQEWIGRDVYEAIRFINIEAPTLVMQAVLRGLHESREVNYV